MECGKILFLDEENFISRREHTQTSISTPGGPVGQSRRKIERIQFLSWFVDFITPLHTVSYICSRAPRTFAAALPRARFPRGGFERERGVGPNGTFEFDKRVTGIETYDWGTHSRNEQRRKGILRSRSEKRWPGLPTSRREASREARKRRGKTFR